MLLLFVENVLKIKIHYIINFYPTKLKYFVVFKCVYNLLALS